MLPPYANKKPGWQDWLQRFALWDEQLSEDQLYLRFLRFSEVTFGVVPEAEWGLFFKDLLWIEDFFVFGDSIGLASEYPFRFTVNDRALIRKRATPLALEARQWVNQYLDRQVKLGVLREIDRSQEDDPTFVVNIVLVRGGQSQQDYRLCGNFPEMNARLELPAHAMLDCETALDGMKQFDVMSSLDIKAGFNNVPVPAALQQYLGLVTQDALYQYRRMPFGANAAPAHFQFLMNQALKSISPRPAHSTYVDDCGTGGRNVPLAWWNTLLCLVGLCAAGLPISIRKCKFLVRALDFLGLMLADQRFALGKKCLQNLFCTNLPSNIRQVKGLLGKLNFASQFVPNFKALVAPIVGLLNKGSKGVWTSQHTESLNRVVEQILRRVQLGFYSLDTTAWVHVDCNDTDFAATLVQEKGGERLVCALVGRRMLASEKRLPRLEQLLLAATWAIQQLQRCCYYVPRLVVVLPGAVEMAAVSGRSPPPRLAAKLVALSSFRVEFAIGVGAQDMMAGLTEPSLAQQQSTELLPPAEETLGEKATWTHPGDYILEGTAQAEEARSLVDTTGATLLYFDGGCSKSLGAGGYIAWDNSLQCLGGGYKFYGKSRGTNNECKAEALLDALQHGVANGWFSGDRVVVRGDSSLIINFMRGVFAPRKRALVQQILCAKQLVKGVRKAKFVFQHVGREFNQWADQLARVALKVQSDGDLFDLVHAAPYKVPPSSIQEFAAPTFELARDTPACCVCHEPIRTRAVRCGGCNRQFHSACLDATLVPQRPGPWHCGLCRAHYKRLKLRDLTLDEALLRFLTLGELPIKPAEQLRVVRASRYCRVNPEGQLWVVEPGGRSRRVPSFYDRPRIVNKFLQKLAYPNGGRLYLALKQSFVWHGMYRDCSCLAKASVPRQLEGAKFKPPPFLFPTGKGSMPLAQWSIDTIVGLRPAAPDGSTDIILAVDPYSKWVECARIPLLNSHETALFLHNELVCRYGLPSCIRTDKGTEYQGAFDKYCQENGIRHNFISTMHPRANGQAERYVRATKAAIRKLLAKVTHGRWWEVLGDVQRGMRFVPVKATGFAPYLLVFKQEPWLEVPAVLSPVFDDQCADLTTEQVDDMVAFWDKFFGEVCVSLNEYDEKMIKSYLESQRLAEHDIRFIFKRGQQVILRSKEPGKMKCRAIGPYTFVRYTGELGVTAQVLSKSGKLYQVSGCNLLPLNVAELEQALEYLPAAPQSELEVATSLWDSSSLESG